MAQSLRRERLVATMTTAFGVLATLHAVVGLYGVMSYTVARRTREIGVRVAFGATAVNISWLVVREVIVIATIGVLLGLPLALWLGKFVDAQLYGVKPNDPLTAAATALMLLAVGVAAGIVPALRAARLDPTTALRQ